jgi:4,5-DOPA dioxygenase extradiol
VFIWFSRINTLKCSYSILAEAFMSLSPLPVLFVSHGAPTFATDPGVAGPRLGEVGRRLAGVSAVLVVSPHWQTDGAVHVGSVAAPETIHDFGGFPRALYALRYPVAGHPVLAQRAAGLLGDAGFPVRMDETRGLDHGAWVPLMHLLPDAGVPVFQVSPPHGMDTAGALALGRALAPLREQGVLIVGSGSLTHNLYEFRGQHLHPEAYAAEFTQWVREAMQAGDVEALLDYRQRAPHAQRAHPTEEHFLPLLVAVGAATPADPVEVIDGGIVHGVLSMESYVLGVLAA